MASLTGPGPPGPSALLPRLVESSRGYAWPAVGDGPEGGQEQ